MIGKWLNHLGTKARDDRPVRDSGLREEKEKIISLWKEEGETPLECISRARESGLLGKEEKATYAGRLDPMAEGILLVLTGERVHEKEKYLKLPKTYEVEILFGVASDTGDTLGIVKDVNFDFSLPKNSSGPRISLSTRPDHEEFLGEPLVEKIQNALQKCIGTFKEDYPRYSSKRLNSDDEEPIPSHTVSIRAITLHNIRTEILREICGSVLVRCQKVKGDFRQEEIGERWRDIGEKYGDREMCIASVAVSAESGAYMRVLAEKVGKLLGVPALAYRIVRTKLGEYERD